MRHLPEKLNLSQAPIYRPQYQPRVRKSTYRLNGVHAAEETDASGLFEPVEALDSWLNQSEATSKDVAPRWHPDKALQLQVYIAPAQEISWHSLCLQACQEWEAASAGLLKFMITVRPETADIKVIWADMPVLGREFEVGHTRNQVRPPHWISQATITLLQTPAIDTHLSPHQITARLYSTFLHELGHALGLEHSVSARDVMHHQGWRNTVLTPNDSQRCQALYRQSPPTQFML